VTTSAIAELLRNHRSRIESFDAATDESLLAIPLMAIESGD